LICAIWLAVRLLERVLLFGLCETLEEREELVLVRFATSSSISFDDSVTAVDSSLVEELEELEELSSDDLHPVITKADTNRVKKIILFKVIFNPLVDVND